ncbi:probable 26S proteasome regulatory subunit p28 [[Candida] anglica]|uniref:Probable 26S proteasome regulatory subunit p28 n=1 Tax=[Candida] anglica TaxID=148631 RepID=A0ABP0E9A0_9ASCO
MTDKYAIQEAARDGKILTVEALLTENPKLIFSKDQDERTALHWACSSGHLNIVLSILKPRGKEIEIDDMLDSSGWSPVHIAASAGYEEIFDTLMSNNPQPDIDLPTNQGTAVIHLACSKKHYDIVKKSIETYKCKTRAKDKMGYTPLHRAASVGDFRIVELLLKSGVNVNATDKEDWTALMHAEAEGWTDVVELLKANGAEITKKD